MKPRPFLLKSETALFGRGDEVAPGGGWRRPAIFGQPARIRSAFRVVQEAACDCVLTVWYRLRPRGASLVNPNDHIRDHLVGTPKGETALALYAFLDDARP